MYQHNHCGDLNIWPLAPGRCYALPTNFESVSGYPFSLELNQEFAFIPCGFQFDGQFINLKNLTLTGGRDVYLHAKIFQKLKLLEILKINNNGMKILNSQIFDNLPNLKFIDLSDNRLDETQINKINHIFSMAEILMSGNRITSINPTWFQDTPAFVTSINLSHNLITRVEYTSFSSVRDWVTSIDLSYNRIEYINPDALTDFAGLAGLEKIDLRYNRIKSMVAGTIPSMVKVYLESNNFCQAKNCDNVDPSDNHLCSCEQKIF